jgi:hypothetical protein
VFKVADINKVSKRKASETIQPLFNKYEKPDEWRYVLDRRTCGISSPALIISLNQVIKTPAGNEKFANLLSRKMCKLSQRYTSGIPRTHASDVGCPVDVSSIRLQQVTNISFGTWQQSAVPRIDLHTLTDCQKRCVISTLLRCFKSFSPMSLSLSSRPSDIAYISSRTSFEVVDYKQRSAGF